MPDKHEVGGSSPLGPTSKANALQQLKKSAESDLVLSSSEKFFERGTVKAWRKGREAERGNSEASRER